MSEKNCEITTCDICKDEVNTGLAEWTYTCSRCGKNFCTGCGDRYDGCCSSTYFSLCANCLWECKIKDENEQEQE